MADRMEASWQGMGQLIKHTHEQYLNLSEVSGFTHTAGLHNTGAFSGVLGLFAGSYESALNTVDDSLSAAMNGARDLSEAIADTRDDFRKRDEVVTMRNIKLKAQVEDGAVHMPADSDGVPQVNDHVVNAHDVVNHDWNVPGLPPPKGMPAPNVNSPLGLVDATASLSDNANSTGNALDHDDDFDDFLGRHPQR